MKIDITTEADVEQMVRSFYGAVVQDELLGPIFTTVANVDWSTHIPKLSLFWCRNLFGTPGYQGNALRAHRAIHEQSPFQLEHFARWLDIFDDTIDANWRGPNAERAKSFARRVASVQGKHLINQEVVDADLVVSETTHPAACGSRISSPATLPVPRRSR